MNCKCGAKMKSIYSEVKLFEGGLPFHRPVIWLEKPAVVIIWSCDECGRSFTERKGPYVDDGIMPAEEWSEPPEPEDEGGKCSHDYVQSFKDRHSFGHRCMHCGEVTFQRSRRESEESRHACMNDPSGGYEPEDSRHSCMNDPSKVKV